jgi:hypothetical protein
MSSDNSGEARSSHLSTTLGMVVLMGVFASGSLGCAKPPRQQAVLEPLDNSSEDVAYVLLTQEGESTSCYARVDPPGKSTVVFTEGKRRVAWVMRNLCNKSYFVTIGDFHFYDGSTPYDCSKAARDSKQYPFNEADIGKRQTKVPERSATSKPGKGVVRLTALPEISGDERPFVDFSYSICLSDKEGPAGPFTVLDPMLRYQR